jgi:hypothetical protein
MTPDELLRTMRATLMAERDALQRLDIEGIENANDIKESVLLSLRGLPPSERSEMFRALAELETEMRENLALLEQARALIAEKRAERTRESGAWPVLSRPSADTRRSKG